MLFLPARKMSMERVGQSGLKNLFMITKAAEGGRSEASVVAVGIRVLSLPCVKFVPVIFLVVALFLYKFIYFSWRLITLQYCIGFGVQQYESAPGCYTFKDLCIVTQVTTSCDTLAKAMTVGVDHLDTVHSFEALALVGSGIGHFLSAPTSVFSNRTDVSS